MIFPLRVAERSVRKQAVNPRKLHAVDWSLGYPFVPEKRIDVGHKLETAVFLHWRRQRQDLGYFGGEREIDLVLHPDRPQAVINVAFSVTQPQTWDREIGALEAAVVRAPDAERILIVHERPQRALPKSIQLVDAWRYLLGESPERPVRAQRTQPKTAGRRSPRR